MTAPLVVVGDLIHDVDLLGRAERLSPEAPVPVLSELEQRDRPGGAALAAWLAAAAARRPVLLVAPLADDAAGRRVAELLAGQGANRVELIGLPWQGSTPVKTRIRAGQHAIARLDTGGRPGPLGQVPDRALAAIRTAAAVLVCDYGRGATSHPELRAALAGTAGPVLWDPHPNGATPVPGCALVMPNEQELRGFTTHVPGKTAAMAQSLAARWRARTVAVTVGGDGALVCQGDHAPLAIRGRRVAAVDTCGAGDSFAAAAALAMADGRLPTEAVTAAVAAANRFVAAGAAAALRFPPPAVELSPAIPAESATTGRSSRGAGLVATGGCFDLLHAGHIAALREARELGDRLVVCLNSDASVRRLKGAGRPLQPQRDRAEVLRALSCVDDVVIFDEDTPAEVLRRVRPDLWVKGGDYTGAELPEAAILAEWGGQVVIVPYLQGRSTSALVEQAARPVVAP
ncbi:MAG TPA: D-glycero-beta-D-manno-heptose 1-phosphate adenylyltransferase [Jatrophihabitans sp.]|nr:D-glycero-beta-D-manno-heptose 1-phosphate adenylyltransferase [Jatrophihabitans sp.]